MASGRIFSVGSDGIGSLGCGVAFGAGPGVGVAGIVGAVAAVGVVGAGVVGVVGTVSEFGAEFVGVVGEVGVGDCAIGTVCSYR